MSYCLNPDCLEPGRQRSPHPEQAKFCSNCGAKLLLSDRYRAQRPIGQGGFGRTFLAIDEHKPSKPYCVIKQSFIQSQKGDELDQAVALFRQEAMRLEELGQHPQIPALLAHFEQDRRQYLIQEFIDGQNLLQQLRRSSAFDEHQIRQLLNHLLPVLHFIHTHQVIHRDIKPENIICRRLDDQLVLVDFGAAKFATPSNLMQIGTKIGSRGYTAPEQASGRATFTSDLYSLGVTCIQLLTEKPPTAMLQRKPPGWTWRSYLKHPISESLGQILDKLIQFEIQDRYRSAEAVLDDLTNSAADISDRPTFVPLSPRRSRQDATLFTTHSPDSIPDAQTSAHPNASASGWQCVQTIAAHAVWVRSVALSPDSRILASGSGDKTVKVWSVPESNLLHTLKGHTSWVRGVAIAPDNLTIASASNDRTIRLWHGQTGEAIAVLNGHGDWVRTVTFTPDGSQLVSGAQDKTLRIWPLMTDETPRSLTGHEHWVLSTAISPDGVIIASGSRDHTIRLWQTATGRCLHTLTDHTAEVLSVAIHPSAPLLASASFDQTVRLWDLHSGKLINRLIDHDSAVNAVAFSPDGLTLASAGSDKTIRLWDLQTAQCMAVLSGHLGWVWSIAFADANTLVSGSWDGALKFWKRSP
jgi:WD40 repeat protein/tRNA A-37 threonylcarbamoyl transferase component Bud32